MEDNVYVYRKLGSLYAPTLLGEIQSDFNMGFAIDGSKDSAKMTISAFQKLDIKPYDIIEHRKTNTWWVVADDKIERKNNDVGFYYEHTISLVGAIELLNSIDMTDCAFLSNRYTLREMLERCVKLSFNDLPPFNFQTNYLIDLDTTVNYTKTFENYTLLSALREIMDGYNCSLKLTFQKNTSLPTRLIQTNINIIPKTGNGNVVDGSLFNLVDEKTIINKSNYGTSVVSNAQNVISSKAKTYPAVGSVRLSANEYEIKRETAILRLPNKVYDINWVKMQVPLSFRVYCFEDGIDQHFEMIIDKTQSNKKLRDFLLDIVGTPTSQFERAYNVLIDRLDRGTSVYFVGGNKYDPLEKKVYPKEGTKTPLFIFGDISAGGQIYYEGPVYLLEKHLRDSTENPNKAEYFWWERGSDILSGFNFTRNVGTNLMFSQIWDWRSTELKTDDWDAPEDNVIWERTFGSKTIRVFLEFGSIAASSDYDNAMATNFDVSDIRFVVNYIPMTDMKIKYNNKGNKEVASLYNQNGKITDSVALSKLMLSHAKEIESDKITKYGMFYSFDDVPKVGNVVLINGEKYVIGSSSLDFEYNDYDEYFISGEFTLSKNIATKSLMVNPDTNIRDYNIPQNMNLKRVQVYKDFYELTHTFDSNRQIPLQDIANILNVGNYFKALAEHTAIMRLDYIGAVGVKDVATVWERLAGIHRYTGGSSTWYYQLDSTTIPMKKAVYEIVDFKDNNIIGYDAMNTITGFKINEIISGNADNIATPISYVDDLGRVKDIRIAFCNGEQLSTIYQNYLDSQSGGDTYDGNIINYSVFIDSHIYEGDSGNYDGAKDYNDFIIEEQNYNKDALEVPVFEYICQLDDSNDVIIGDDIFDTNDDDFCYFYSCYLVDKGTIDNSNFASLQVSKVYEDDEGGLQLETENIAIQLTLTGSSSMNRRIDITKYNTVGYESGDGVVYSGKINFTSSQLANKDLVIVRHIIKNNYTVDQDAYVSQQTQLMFVLKNTENITIYNGNIEIGFNAYRMN